MSKLTQIRQIHENMNDIFTDLHTIHVADQTSWDAKQSAMLSLISMRKTIEAMGLSHAIVDQSVA